MNIVIFGLTLSSSWGNGHATIWRSLLSALAARGHKITFYERDVPYYASNRDLTALPGVDLVLYSGWDELITHAAKRLAEAGAAIVTSYCPDGAAASELLFTSFNGCKIFYDLDTPVTLKEMDDGRSVPYIHPEGLRGFDIVLSYTGGRALYELKSKLGASFTAPLYGCADPATHRQAAPSSRYRCFFSYLGTYASDRQTQLYELFIKAAERFPERKFIIGGSMYPEGFPWRENIWYLAHVPPPEHPAFYCSSLFTLNITRGTMAAMGYCPSGRLFEAAACGTPIISDSWEGIDSFFEPGREIIIVKTAGEVVKALQMPEAERMQIAEAARRRVLHEHTGEIRAEEFENILARYINVEKEKKICGE